MPLPYYSRAATQEFWQEHWAGQDTRGLLDIARASPLTAIIEAALPPAGRVLEAGCGLGQYVILMRERGHRALGADWSLDALARCRAAVPGTPLAVMDLARLGVRDRALDAYVSLGVVEHDPEGPGRILAEAARVLAPGARLIVSVPYANGMRRMAAPRIHAEARRLRAAGGQFYQFAFSRAELGAALAAHGFRVVSFHPYDPLRLLRPGLRRLRRALSPAGSELAARDTHGRIGSGRRGDVPVSRGDVGSHANATVAAPASRGAIAGALRRLAYSPPALRLLAHMLLAVAVRR